MTTKRPADASTALSVEAAGFVVGLVFLTAAGAKLVSPFGLHSDIRYLLAPQPFPVQMWLGGGVVALETWLGLCFCFGRSLRSVVPVAIGTLVMFSAVLVKLWLDPHPPGCGCMPAILRIANARHEAVVGMARNAVLIAMLLFICWRLRLQLTQPRSQTSTPQQLGHDSTCG